MKVLVVSNHILIGESLVTLVSNLPARAPIDCSFCLPSAAAATIRTSRPVGVLIEATTDFASAISTVYAIKSTDPYIRILVIGKSDDEASVLEAISAGADGYLASTTSAKVLLATLEGIMRGELGLSRAAALLVVQQLRRAIPTPLADVPADLQGRLTRREREVFQLVRRGMRSREIAAELSIAEGTVYKHIHNVLDKLQARSRTHAVILAELEAFPYMSDPHADPSGSVTSAS